MRSRQPQSKRGRPVCTTPSVSQSTSTTTKSRIQAFLGKQITIDLPVPAIRPNASRTGLTSFGRLRHLKDRACLLLTASDADPEVVLARHSWEACTMYLDRRPRTGIGIPRANCPQRSLIKLRPAGSSSLYVRPAACPPPVVLAQASVAVILSCPSSAFESKLSQEDLQ